MSDEQRRFFEHQYRQMTTDDLVDRWRRGNLTDIATEVLDSVLTERGIDLDRREAISRELQEDSYEEQYSHLAPLRDRFLGQLIDNIVALTCGALAFLVLKGLPVSEASAGLGALLAWFAYNLFSDGMNRGQSLGKRVAKTAVVYGLDRRPCSYGRSFLRNLPLLLLGLFDWIPILGDSRKRIGDYLAGTEVIKANRGLESENRCQSDRKSI